MTIQPDGLKRSAAARRVIVDRPAKAAPAALTNGGRLVILEYDGLPVKHREFSLTEAILGQLLRADLLPAAWIAPPAIRELRALLRHRVDLVRLRTRLRNRIHAIVADYGYDRPAGGYWTGPGRAWLATLELSADT